MKLEASLEGLWYYLLADVLFGVIYMVIAFIGLHTSITNSKMPSNLAVSLRYKSFFLVVLTLQSFLWYLILLYQEASILLLAKILIGIICVILALSIYFRSKSFLYYVNAKRAKEMQMKIEYLEAENRIFWEHQNRFAISSLQESLEENIEKLKRKNQRGRNRKAK